MTVQIHLPKSKWTKDNVVNYILACRADEGLPIFKTRFGGLPLESDGKKAVMAICWGGHELVSSKAFVDVPEEDLKLIEESVSDWRKLIEKYGTEEEKKKALSGGIYIRGVKLPKFGYLIEKY